MNGENKTTIVNKTIKTGITFGSALAMVISYTTWHSVGWAIFHGLLSWVYVVYFVPVSYTHLDVYKRQGTACAPEWRRPQCAR